MARTDRLIRSMLRTRYGITLNTEETFDGVLVDVDDQHVVLADATQIAPDGSRVVVDGNLWIPRFTIKYMQTVTS